MQLITTGQPLRFVQIWPSAVTGEWVRREGSVGRTGRITETGLRPEAVDVHELAAPYLAKGFVERDDEALAWVVMQFPLENAAYDRRLIERASEDVAAVLDERGLGYVDGWDRGKRLSDGKIVSNVFARVVDGELGSVAAMAGLRLRGSDPRRATIAHRLPAQEDWTLRYERSSHQLPGAFSL
ncbi:MAG: hypothetical protein LBE25_15860 [Arthrobacter sp.]|jgi:hypothetical protein|nr:hypothetical protein [Arthrobacter sp.]